MARAHAMITMEHLKASELVLRGVVESVGLRLLPD